jgi:hypothetical protein
MQDDDGRKDKLGIPRRRKDNIKMALGKMGWCELGCSGSG